MSCFSLSRICRVGRQNKHDLGKSCPEETLRLAAQSVPFIQVLKNTKIAKNINWTNLCVECHTPTTAQPWVTCTPRPQTTW